MWKVVSQARLSREGELESGLRDYVQRGWSESGFLRLKEEDRQVETSLVSGSSE